MEGGGSEGLFVRFDFILAGFGEVADFAEFGGESLGILLVVFSMGLHLYDLSRSKFTFFSLLRCFLTPQPLK